MTTIHDALVALNKAGMTTSAINEAQAEIAEQLGIGPVEAGNIKDAVAALSRAQRLTSELGDRHLKAIEKDLLALQAAPTPPADPPVEQIVAWARRVHPETDIGNGFALHTFFVTRTDYPTLWAAYIAQQVPPPPYVPPVTPPADPEPLPPPTVGVTVIRWAPTGFTVMRPQTMPTPVVAYQFVALVGAGKVTTSEYIGDPRNREHCVSERAGDFASPLAKASRSGPASSTLTFLIVGSDQPGHTRLEVGRTYYHNIRAAEAGPLGGWNAEFGRQQFGVSNSVAA